MPSAEHPPPPFSEAVLTVQQSVRRFLLVHNSAWLALWKQTRELIPMARDRRRLADLEKEVHSLKEVSR